MAALVTAADLPESPLDAAAQFHAAIVPVIREKLAEATEIVVNFGPAEHSHRAWRLAAIQELAREAAPVRVNGLVGPDGEGAHAVMRFLENAPGITGQLLAVDGKSGEIG